MAVKTLEVDLTEVSGYIDGEENEIIRRALQKSGFCSAEFLYSVFNGDRAKQVKKIGQYRFPKKNSIFAFRIEELVWENPLGPNSIKTHTRQYNTPALAIYNKNHFIQKPSDDVYEYSFKNSSRKKEALAGIAFLRMPGPD